MSPAEEPYLAGKFASHALLKKVCHALLSGDYISRPCTSAGNVPHRPLLKPFSSPPCFLVLSPSNVCLHITRPSPQTPMCVETLHAPGICPQQQRNACDRMLRFVKALLVLFIYSFIRILVLKMGLSVIKISLGTMARKVMLGYIGWAHTGQGRRRGHRRVKGFTRSSIITISIHQQHMMSSSSNGSITSSNIVIVIRMSNNSNILALLPA